MEIILLHSIYYPNTMKKLGVGTKLKVNKEKGEFLIARKWAKEVVQEEKPSISVKRENKKAPVTKKKAIRKK